MFVIFEWRFPSSKHTDGKEDPVEDVESQGTTVEACWISNKGIPSQKSPYILGEESL